MWARRKPERVKVMAIGSIKDPPLPMPPSRTGVARSNPTNAAKWWCEKHFCFQPEHEACVYCDVPKESIEDRISKALEARIDQVAGLGFGTPVILAYHHPVSSVKELNGFKVGDHVYSGIGPAVVVSIEKRNQPTEVLWVLADDPYKRNFIQSDGAYWSSGVDLTIIP